MNLKIKRQGILYKFYW